MLKGKHAFGPRGFGPWLFNVTEVDPNNPGNARPLQDFSKKELDFLNSFPQMSFYSD